MTTSSCHPDDPRLTAYVLGELDEHEREALEAQLAASPECRCAVDELRATCASLFEALQIEAASAAELPQPVVVTAGAGHAPLSPPTRGKLVAVASVVAVAVLGGVAVIVPTLQTTPTRQRPESLANPTHPPLVQRSERESQVSGSETTVGQVGDVGRVVDASAATPRGESVVPASPVVALVQSGDAVRQEREIAAQTRSLSEGVISEASPQPAASGYVVPDPMPPGAGTSSASLGTSIAAGTPVAEGANVPYNPPLEELSAAGAPGATSGVDGLRRLARTSPESRGTPVPQLGLPTAGSQEAAKGLVITEPHAATPVPAVRLAEVSGRGRLGSQLNYDHAALAASPPADPGVTGLAIEQEVAGGTLGQRDYYFRFIPRPSPSAESYAPIIENEFVSPQAVPLSTFGLDVDTASYANVRRFLLEEHRLPPPHAVRLEELINYFTYSDPEPGEPHPVGVALEVGRCPWEPAHHLVRIGVKGRTINLENRPPTTLVYLVDTSGSMRDANKLPLVQQSLRLLASQMTENDRIAIVTYSDSAGLLLDSTPGDQRDTILAAIDGLVADGSTNGEAGLRLAYDVATRHFLPQGQNRVILCTDGDFNVGESADAPLVRLIMEKRQTGVFLSICGFGTGNLKDSKLEQIADHGNGQYHYVDSRDEARKVFLNDLTGMLYTVAQDVKLQVEFNPAHVAAYRLLGYENRTLAAEEFRDDRVDAGDLGAGDSVTALYEIVPAGVASPRPEGVPPGGEPLKYSGRLPAAADSPPLATPAPEAEARPANETTRELLTVKLRYKQPGGDESRKLEFPLIDSPETHSASADLEWAAAVASFGMIIRQSPHRGQGTLAGVLDLARRAQGVEPSGQRSEFIEMVLEARRLMPHDGGPRQPTPPRLSATEAREKATVGGKYADLLDKLHVPDDLQNYGEFREFGYWSGTSYAGREGLPPGYWVYVYPDWYIWARAAR
jgi:Ca-activated chloride channel family protein